MSVRVLSAAGALATVAVLSFSSPALAVCDAYSGGCPSTPPTAGPGGGSGTPIGGGNGGPGSGTPGTKTPPETTANPSTLPFTGGELMLMTVIGAGALAGGTALVVAGRRRGTSPS